LGADVGAELGDLAESGSSIVAEVTGQLGPLGAKLGVELDSSGCLSGDAAIKTPLGDISPSGYKPPGLSGDIELNGAELALKSARAKVQGKVAGKVCGQLPF
jgi:hypothetical protein